MQFDFELSLQDELINIHYYDDTFKDIPLNRFWDWIKSTDRNGWVNNYYDPRQDDGHGQDSGEYTFDEYFDLPHDVIHKHLSDYLTKNKGRDKI